MNFGLTKRQKIIITSIVVTFALLSTQLVNFNLRFQFLGGLFVITYLLSLWALWEGIDRRKALILLVLPTFYTLAVGSSYFLLPIRWLTRLPVATIFGFSFYLLLLSQNVFNVASIRTIPLYRAASTANFLFTLVTAFFLYFVISAFNLLFLWNGLAVFLVSFPLILQVIWSIEMEESIPSNILAYSFILSLILAELATVYSFWPIHKIMGSLTLACSMYVLVGLTTHLLRKKLNKGIVREYLSIGLIILIISFLTTSWTG